MSSSFKLSCVLFDLDGTLVDTAPDLIACLNKALLQYGFNEVTATKVKPLISFGAETMIKSSVEESVNQQTRNKILDTMLDCYQHNISQYSQFFSGINETLNTIESLNLKWGIVTNKRERFTQPLVKALNLTNRASCIISGDTTPNRKPHSEPLFTACSLANVKPEECVYIGDALHDIVAGKNANMKTLAAVYGYLKVDDTPDTWGADALIESPEQLTSWITATCH
ncbi:MAG: HAD-IA family hydrolase [Methylococcales symbiont of Iophon sp. n. MRB-2018]|nr:MAG: HAD-IA family hydrolase [Methylococcales symbiont of Iophon sp. n. MRB-2018]KAF3979247.1 MAG: HAD-IA family hydrolase [Methylococcales symbiont of Iophon sp. n. MRB-2018]